MGREMGNLDILLVSRYCFTLIMYALLLIDSGKMPDEEHHNFFARLRGYVSPQDINKCFLTTHTRLHKVFRGKKNKKKYS